MPKNHRLTGAEIRRLTPEKRLNSSLFSLSVARHTSPEGKVACVVSKKISAKATIRNRIKRRMRAALKHASPLPPGVSLVLTAKRQVADAPYGIVRDDVVGLINRVRSGK